MRQALTTLLALLLLPMAAMAYSNSVTLNHTQLGALGTHTISLPAAPGLAQVLRQAKVYARLDLGDDYDLGTNAWTTRP